jgi:hypothetical protein
LKIKNKLQPTLVAVAQLPSENNFFRLSLRGFYFLVKGDFYFVATVVMMQKVP